MSVQVFPNNAVFHLSMSSRTQFKQNYLRDIAYVTRMFILSTFSDSLSFCIWTWNVTETLFFLIAKFYLFMIYKT